MVFSACVGWDNSNAVQYEFSNKKAFKKNVTLLRKSFERYDEEFETVLKGVATRCKIKK